MVKIEIFFSKIVITIRQRKLSRWLKTVFREMKEGKDHTSDGKWERSQRETHLVVGAWERKASRCSCAWDAGQSETSQETASNRAFCFHLRILLCGPSGNTSS